MMALGGGRFLMNELPLYCNKLSTGAIVGIRAIPRKVIETIEAIEPIG